MAERDVVLVGVRDLEPHQSAPLARFEVAAAAITAYDPGLDGDGRVARAAMRVIGRLADGALAA